MPHGLRLARLPALDLVEHLADDVLELAPKAGLQAPAEQLLRPSGGEIGPLAENLIAAPIDHLGDRRGQGSRESRPVLRGAIATPGQLSLEPFLQLGPPSVTRSRTGTVLSGQDEPLPQPLPGAERGAVLLA